MRDNVAIYATVRNALIFSIIMGWIRLATGSSSQPLNEKGDHPKH